VDPRPPHAGFHWRIWAAEAAGTGLLMLGGLSVIAALLAHGSPAADVIPSHSARLLVVGVLFGSCVAAIAISPLGRLSGAHLNPAVTLAFRVLGKVSWHDVAGYLVAQLVGAVAGSLAFRALWGHGAVSVGGGETHSTVGTPAALLLEALMTAALVGTILAFDSRERLMRWTPVAIVPVIAVLVWQVGDYTGTSLNPARSAGPAIAFGDLGGLWLYLLAPCAGAVAIAAAWRLRGSAGGPKTAKLFHDPRYACSLSTDVPAATP
jgi:aquaporin Z